MKSMCRAGDISGKNVKSDKQRRRANLLLGLLFVLSLVLLFPARSEAYAGPGAGFAVLSSFWTLFVAFLYSLYAFLTWPFRHLLRSLRRRKTYGKAQFKRAVILGFDGMDPELAERFIAEGNLPNLARLREKGTFRKLRTTYPPISPVAWSTFMTGVNPGKHNIYDFLARDLSNYLPYLSSAEIKGPKRSLKIGKYIIPLGKPQIKGMRRGTPFWHWLGEAGIFCSVIRVPVTFPPEKFSGVLLSGMCVPDLKGSQGTFCFCTTRASGDKFREGGVRVPIERNGNGYNSYIPGPEDPLAAGKEMRVGFQIRPEVSRNQARIEVDGQDFTLKPFVPASGVGVGAVARDLEEDDGDVVLAAALVRRPDECLRGRREVVAVALDLAQDRPVVDHRGEAVRAEQEQVAGLRLDGERVDVDVGVGAERTRDHRALGVGLGLLGRELAAADELGDQRVVLGQLLELAVADQVGAAVPHVGEIQLVVEDVQAQVELGHQFWPAFVRLVTLWSSARHFLSAAVIRAIAAWSSCVRAMAARWLNSLA